MLDRLLDRLVELVLRLAVWSLDVSRAAGDVELSLSSSSLLVFS